MIRQGQSSDLLGASTRPERTPRTPAQLRETARAYRDQAAEGRRALPRTRVGDRPGLSAKIQRMERLASELERAAQRAEELAA